jgi:hypothetical protein
MQSTHMSRAVNRFAASGEPIVAVAARPDIGAAVGGTARSSAPFTLTSLVGPAAANDAPDAADQERVFTIRAADEDGHRNSAGILVDRMYAGRGYRTNGLAEGRPGRITLTACQREHVMGTITVGFDSTSGLFVDELFAAEVDTLRRNGHRVCEFTKLAVDRMVRSRRVLASLFHVAYICARRLADFTDLLIEVNPRHVRYYERMLGFTARSEERCNPRVEAPAVLMALDLAHAESQIQELGGRGNSAGDAKSLYPYFFSPAEETGIIARLRRR